MGKELTLPRRILAILLGGFLGTTARYLLSLLIQSYLGKGWPYDILFINLTGAFLLAFFTTLADAAILIGPTRRLFVNVGFLGAYTTFSSLALGDILLSSNGQWLPACLYLFLSIIGGILLIVFGTHMGQWFVRRIKQASTHQITSKLIVPTLQNLHSNNHVDIDDDVLYPEEQR